MNAKSKGPFNFFRVSSAGASLSWIFPATEAIAQYFRAMAVHSSLTSQQTIRPPGGSASATASAE